MIAGALGFSLLPLLALLSWLRTPGRDAREPAVLAALAWGVGILVLIEVLSGLAAAFHLSPRCRCDERAARSGEPRRDGLRMTPAARRPARSDAAIRTRAGNAGGQMPLAPLAEQCERSLLALPEGTASVPLMFFPVQIDAC